MLKLAYETIEDAKGYIRKYLKENDLQFMDLLNPEYKEFRLMLLLSIRPLVELDILKKYDYNESALFVAIFNKPFKYSIPIPMMLPEVTLSKQEQAWYNKIRYVENELTKRTEKKVLKEAGIDINALQNEALTRAAKKIAEHHDIDLNFDYSNTASKVLNMTGHNKIDRDAIKEQAIHDKVKELGLEKKVQFLIDKNSENLQNTRVQIAYSLINMNNQISLVNIKNMYCYAVNQDNISFDNEDLIQIATILAFPLIPDRIKKAELMDSDRIFFKTFLPDYYESRYTPLDELDLLYCINENIFKNICKMSEIKIEETKWQKNSNGALIDEMIFENLEKYMSSHNIKDEEIIKSLSTPKMIVSESPILSIYNGRKKMIKAAKIYNLPLTFIVKTNFGRQLICAGYKRVLQYNADGTPKVKKLIAPDIFTYKNEPQIYASLYDHLIDMYMIIKSKTSSEGKEFCKKYFDVYYNQRKALNLPSVTVLDEYATFKNQQKVNTVKKCR